MTRTAAIAALSAAVLVTLPGVALGQEPPSCPVPPEAPVLIPGAGADAELLREVRLLRRDTAESCLTQVRYALQNGDKIDQAEAQVRAVKAAADDAALRIIAAIDAQTAANAPTGTTGQPTVVRMAQASPLPDEAVKAYAGLSELLWLLAGLLVAVLVAPFIRGLVRA